MGSTPEWTTISSSQEVSRVAKDIFAKNYVESISSAENSHYAVDYKGGIMVGKDVRVHLAQ